MPRARAKPPKYKRAPNPRQELKQAIGELRKTRRTLKQAQLEAAKAGKPVRLAKVPDADLRRMMKVQARLGVYEPRWDQRQKLTPYRRRAILAKQQRVEDLFETSVIVPLQGMNKADRAALVRDVKASRPGSRKSFATKKVVFYEIMGGEIGPTRTTRKFAGRKERVVTMPAFGEPAFDDISGRFAILKPIRRKRKKKGERRPVDQLITREEVVMVGPGDEVEEEKWQRIGERLASLPPLRPNQWYRIFIGSNPTGAVFRNVAEMRAWMEHYRKDPAARATLLNEVRIVVVQKGPTIVRRVKGATVSDNMTKAVTVVSGRTLRKTKTDVMQRAIDRLESRAPRRRRPKTGRSFAARRRRNRR